MNTTLTAVDGLEVGHYTDLRNATGCSVVICRQGAVGGVDVRGGSPGTRETDLLGPGRRVDQVHAIVLSGGSAFGLDSASGVVSYLAEQGIGFQAGPALVPIVPAAILFDLGLITSEVRPGPVEGRAACFAASSKPVVEGSVGAGTGATVAKGKGISFAVKGGLGSASFTLPGGAVVAAMVAVNAHGGIFDHKSGRLIAGPRREQGDGMDDPVEIALEGLTEGGPRLLTNTTIGVVATNAVLSREATNRLATVSHDGLALTIRPCHTMGDGDTMFALATGRYQEPVQMNALTTAAVEVTAQAVMRAVQSATGLGGVPAESELIHA